MKTELAPSPPVEGEPLPPTGAVERPPQTEPERPAVPSPADLEALGSISLTELMHETRIDETAAARLADKARAQVSRAFYKAEAYGQFAPAVASAIAHHYEPSVEPTYPTAAEIKQQRLSARIISGFLEWFSPRWAQRFDGYLEQKARQKLASVAFRTTQAVDIIGGVPRPKEQFVTELTRMYQASLESGSPQQGIPQITEEIVAGSAQDQTTEEKNPYWFLGKLGRMSALTYRLNRLSLRTAAPEIMQGVERFLRQQNIDVAPASQAETPTLTRRIVQRFAPQKLSRLPRQIEATLVNIYGVLPEDGQRFKKGVYELCKTIATRSHQGETGQDLTQKLVSEIKHLLRFG